MSQNSTRRNRSLAWSLRVAAIVCLAAAWWLGRQTDAHAAAVATRGGNLVVVRDRSGSMRQVSTQGVSRAERAWADWSRSFHASTIVIEVGASVERGTPLAEAVRQAMLLAAERGGATPRVLILSDGAATDVSDPTSLAEGAAALGVRIDAAVYGQDDASAAEASSLPWSAEAWAEPAVAFRGEGGELVVRVEARTTQADRRVVDVEIRGPLRLTPGSVPQALGNITSNPPAVERRLTVQPGQLGEVRIPIDPSAFGNDAHGWWAWRMTLSNVDRTADGEDAAEIVVLQHRLAQGVVVWMVEGRPTPSGAAIARAVSREARFALVRSTAVNGIDENGEPTSRVVVSASGNGAAADAARRSATTLSNASVSDEQLAAALSAVDVLIVGDQPQRVLGDRWRDVINAWVQNGGGLVRLDSQSNREANEALEAQTVRRDAGDGREATVRNVQPGWRWRMTDGPGGAHDTFWGQLVRWSAGGATADHTTQAAQLLLDTLVGRVGESVTVRLVGPDSAGPRAVEARRLWPTSEDQPSSRVGSASPADEPLDWQPPASGLWRLILDGSASAGDDAFIWIETTDDPERAALAANRDWLERLTGPTGGITVAPGEADFDTLRDAYAQARSDAEIGAQFRHHLGRTFRDLGLIVLLGVAMFAMTGAWWLERER